MGQGQGAGMEDLPIPDLRPVQFIGRDLCIGPGFPGKGEGPLAGFIH